MSSIRLFSKGNGTFLRKGSRGYNRPEKKGDDAEGGLSPATFQTGGGLSIAF